jgi:hypothetical protein
MESTNNLVSQSNVITIFEFPYYIYTISLVNEG